jgi:streptogramin lyase
MRARGIAALVLVAVVAVSGIVVYEGFFAQGPVQPQCVSLAGGTHVRTQTTNRTFGAVTEYSLPGNDTWPSAITAAPDGSVWFAEQAVPGVTHLFPSNGTIVEYAWPGYETPTLANCYPTAVSSGIALWNGRVWSADEFANIIFGVGPSDGSVVSINVTGRASYPYWLAVGQDGDLWVSFDDTPATLARIYPNLTVSLIRLSGTGEDSPLQLEFVNATYALLAAINLSTNTTTKGCVCNGHIYSFDPSDAGSTITPSVVGSGYNLVLPTSASYSAEGIWVAQHYASSVVDYDFQTGNWIQYPTSRVPWTNTTLPLQVASNGSVVWFNEHYANKIAVLNPGSGTLTEIDESNPPPTAYGGIQNDEYIALSGGRLWFTSLTGNYVGFVDASYRPSFGLAASGSNAVRIAPGGNASLTVGMSGSWDAPLGVSVSDSENSAAAPTLIRITPSVSAIPKGAGSYSFTLDVAVSPLLGPGEYTVAVTVTDGTMQQSAYIFVTVT